MKIINSEDKAPERVLSGKKIVQLAIGVICEVVQLQFAFEEKTSEALANSGENICLRNIFKDMAKKCSYFYPT